MPNHIKTIKKKLIEFLNSATTTVIQSYGRYLSEDLPTDENEPAKAPGEFKKYHDAGKSAATHLESLMKLVNAADDTKEREKEQEDKRAFEEEQQKKKEQQDAIANASEKLKGR